MTDAISTRAERFQISGKLSIGATGVLLCFAFALIYWPLWGTLAKLFISLTAAEGLASADPALAKKFIGVFAEGTFFWCAICAWIWQTLIFGNYGKYRFGTSQPMAGVWYTGVSVLCGIAGFLALVGLLGVWWTPFNLRILLAPRTLDELKIALEGWEASNFYVLPVIIAQIPFVSLFQKKPWAGNVAPPLDGVGLMATSTVVALIVWVALFVPSFFHLDMGGHRIVTQPLGSWPQVLAFCQGFIFWFLIPAEGGEGYPYKAITSRQPWMGLSGLAVALVCGGIVMPEFYAWLARSFQMNPGVNPYVTAASLELSLIVTMLCWHHLFDDYPGADLVPNIRLRVAIRAAIWLVLGTIFGFVWLDAYKLLPFAGNDLGLGIPMMGVLAGQFALLMVFLVFNTFFDKWPVARRKAG
ncbi:hypothetical protein [Rhodoplanes roseus]|uniref:AAT family amino acid transporter n=1 Tax=Rhodoplanes roseus TaxID=29409 RepID=A0A327L7E3_9BRAD|nr:hypothetical protein [Rhodoplanes roseus]RAI45975.1 hypothetical protein CH341_01290 [Rhodoplanes roseus]